MQNLRNLITPFLVALWHWRWASLAIAWVLCLLGWALIASLPDRYTVTARLVVDTETILSPLMEDMAAAPDFDRQVEMIRDTLFAVPNLQQLIEETGIDTHREAFSEIERAALIEKLSKEVELIVEADNLFAIQFTDRDPDMAHRVVEAMLNIFVQQNLGHSQRDVARATEFIEQQIAAYDLKLREAELSVAQFQRDHAEELGGVERNIRELDRAEADVRRMGAELESVTWRRDQLKVKLDAMPESIPTGSTEGTVSEAQRYLQQLNSELERKRLVYKEQHPDIIALGKLIDEATVRVSEERDGRSTGASVKNPLYAQLKSQLEVAEVSAEDFSRRLQVAREEVATLSSKVRQSPKVEADLKRLTRDYDVLLQQYEKLIKRRESTQLASDLDTGRQRVDFRIVDPPVKPLEPSGPLHGVLMLVVLVLSAGAGITYAVIRLMLSGTVLTANQLRAAFNLPVLGGVSVAQTAWGTRTADRLSFAGGGISLVLLFVTLFYVYEFTTVKLNDLTLLVNLLDSMSSKEANAGL